jgi:anaerobic magnesium-protoporphyrin IX monomethyl ester cyclase
LNGIAFPARDLFPNQSYIRYGKKKYGFSITTVMSTRGCPFRCEFCSNVVFGGSYRERSARNVVDEIEKALALGYDRISFADDVFTMRRERVMDICQEIRCRGLVFKWECLGRVDSVDYTMAQAMKNAGCMRIYFGIESGNEAILAIMNKKITPEQASRAVEAAHKAGLQTGAFFILFYPGDTDESVLGTLRFALSLPLEYLGLTRPYPLPGTALYKRISGRPAAGQARPRESGPAYRVAPFDGDFSRTKMRFAIVKGQVHFILKKKLGWMAPLVLRLYGPATDALLKLLK